MCTVYYTKSICYSSSDCSICANLYFNFLYRYLRIQILLKYQQKPKHRRFLKFQEFRVLEVAEITTVFATKEF